jgi:hypothetical protein
MRKATTRIQFAACLEKEINSSELPQSELAHRLGYSNANVITMFKNSTTRLPLEKVVPMARALHLDPGELLRSWFEVFSPGVLPAIEEHLGPILSNAEKSWIRGLRKSLGSVPQFDDRWSKGIKAVVSGG